MVATDPPVVMYCQSHTRTLNSVAENNASFNENIWQKKELLADPVFSAGFDKDAGRPDKEENKATIIMDKSVENQMPNKEDDILFDNAMFRANTATGKYTDFIVWPALLLHTNGPLLLKGVAQGKLERFQH